MTTRRERVVLDLQDNFTAPMMKAAGAAALLNSQLSRLDGHRTATTSRTIVNDVNSISRAAVQGGESINQLTGRLQLLAKAALVLGPSLIPIGAVAVPAITGLASQLGFAAIGMGSLVVAAQGVGDALKAVNEAALEPTAANIEKAQEAMKAIGPEAQQFVRRFQELRPILGDIRDAAARGWFPGLTATLEHIEQSAPGIERFFEKLGEVGGNLASDTALALTGPEWAEFRAFVEAEAPQAMDDLGRTVGNLTKGLAELWMAFDPLNDDFSSWLLDASERFESWAEGLSETEGFQDFVEYIRRSGPQVADALTAIGDAVLAIIKAASPLGGPVLEAFELIADAIKMIADTPLGSRIFTMAAAFVVLNKTLAITAGLMARMGFAGAAGALAGTRGGVRGGAGGVTPLPLVGQAKAASASLGQLRKDLGLLGRSYLVAGANTEKVTQAQQRAGAAMRQYGSTAAKASLGVAAFAGASGALGKDFELQNTAMLGLIGSMGGPLGAAIGVGIGGFLDFKSAAGESERAVKDFQLTLDSLNTSGVADVLTEVEDAREALLAFREAGKDPLGLVDDLDSQFAEMSALTEKKLDEVAAAEYGLAAATQERARATGIGNKAMAEAIGLMELHTQQALNAFSAETQLREAKLAAAEQAKNSNAGIKNNTAEANANRNALEGLAAAWMNQRDALEESGASQAKIDRQFARTRKSLIDTAVAMGVPIGQARRLADQLLAIPEHVRTEMEIRDRASAKINAIKAQLNHMDGRTVTSTIIVNQRRVTSGVAISGGEGSTRGGLTRASGGPVFGPGTATSDSIPAWLSNGEFVVRASAVDKYGVGFLHDVNAERFASGGRAGSSSTPSPNWWAPSGVRSELDRLSAATEEASKGLRAEAKVRKSLLERELEASKKRVDAIRADIDSLKDSIKTRTQSNLWEEGQGTSLRDLSGMTPEQQIAEINAWKQVNASLMQSPIDVLRADIAQAGELKRLLGVLSRKGLDGAAFTELAGNASMEQIRAMAAGSSAEVQRYERLYEQRSRVSSATASSAVQFSGLASELRAARAEYRQTNRQLNAANKRLEQIEKHGKTAPKETGREVGKAINGNVSAKKAGR